MLLRFRLDYRNVGVYTDVQLFDYKTTKDSFHLMCENDTPIQIQEQILTWDPFG